jgi:hypothetical protein
MEKLIFENSLWRLPNPELEKPESLDNGVYRFKVRVRDVMGNVGVLNVYPNRLDPDPGIDVSKNDKFIEILYLSTTNPIIFWDQSPANFYNGVEELTARLRVQSGNDIVSVYAWVDISPGSGADTIEVPAIQDPLAPNYWDISISPVQLPDMVSGLRTLYARATDTEGNNTISNQSFIMDTTKPWMEFNEPLGLGTPLPLKENLPGNTPHPLRVTSTVQLRGAAIDNERVRVMYYALGSKAVAEADDRDCPILYADNQTSGGWTNTMRHEGELTNNHPGIAFKI